MKRLANNLKPLNKGELEKQTKNKKMDKELEIEKELIFFQAWMVRYGKNPKDENLIKDYLKTKK